MSKVVQSKIQSIFRSINDMCDYSTFGTVSGVKGLSIEVKGLNNFATIGSKCRIITRSEKEIDAEVIGFRDDVLILTSYSETAGIGSGCRAYLLKGSGVVYPSDAMKGRVLNYRCEPIDGKGELVLGSLPYHLVAPPPKAHQRARVKDKLDTGVRAINTFLTTCKGQRQGVFAGSGVGKSILLSMITKFAKSDIKVIGLIGERGREVQEFIQDNLGEEGLKNAVVIVSTSDESALARREATQLTMTVAEYFRDQGKEVIAIIDSVTRYAMALREIGLAAGEAPTARGYTPSVFSELPKILERAGTAEEGKGSITGIFSVLVEGDDQSEPIADTVRSILDGHIVLNREIANRGRFPAIDVLSSASRMLPKCNTEWENGVLMSAKKYIALYTESEDLIKIGAYKSGSNEELDRAIQLYPKLEAFLAQLPDENEEMPVSYQKLAEIIGYS